MNKQTAKELALCPSVVLSLVRQRLNRGGAIFRFRRSLQWWRAPALFTLNPRYCEVVPVLTEFDVLRDIPVRNLHRWIVDAEKCSVLKLEGCAHKSELRVVSSSSLSAVRCRYYLNFHDGSSDSSATLMIRFIGTDGWSETMAFYLESSMHHVGLTDGKFVHAAFCNEVVRRGR